MLAVLGGVAGAATKSAKPATPSRVVTIRRDTSPVVSALSMVNKVAVTRDEAVVTYRTPDEKRSRDVVVDYTELVSAVLWSSGGSPIGLLMMTVMSVSLAMRIRRLAHYREARIPEVARRETPPADRP